MSRVEEIRQALKWLSADELQDIADWLGERIETVHGGHTVAEPAAARAETLPSYMTVDEYFALEEASQFKHEYVNGVVYAMSGASLDHVRIAGNLYVAVTAHLRGGPCEAFSSDAKLRIHSETDNIIYYPDLTVACNKEEWGKNYVCNPKLVVEILSPSTESIDRREKATIYRRVRSVEEYVLIEQDEYKVMVQRRADNWLPRMYSGPEAAAEFQSISLAVPLQQIYAGTLK